MEEDTRVAVVGLGALGLVTVKNLVEAGFNAVGFDKNDWVGGLWHFTEEDKTSVLPSTVINISKERSCFTDFPFPAEAASHSTSADVQRYLEDYVEHFNLRPRLRLGTSVGFIRRNVQNDMWELEIEGEESQFFNKIVIATGICQVPVVPELPGSDKFKGEMIHSRAFKRGDKFDGRRVLVVGMSNTGADTVEELRGHATKIYLSHRHGSYVIPRALKGVLFDHTLTLRKASIGAWLGRWLPSLSEFMMNTMIKKIQNSTFDIRPEWRVSPAPSIKHGVPVVSDNLIDNFSSGAVKSVVGIKGAVGADQIELTDGSIVEVDAIIWCTGYKGGFSILDPSADPTRNTTPFWDTLPGSKGKPLPRLYQNIISLDYPQTLAFMGYVAYATGAFPLYDIASMALAQTWAGKSQVPTTIDMTRWVDRQHEFICNIAKHGSVIPGWVREGEWMAWANAAAGTGVDEYLGWGWKGWMFWLREGSLYKLLMDGVYSPHIYRVFEGGKRKAWDGALAEIERVNQALIEKRNK